MSNKRINFQNKFSLFSEQWAPRVIAELNDYQFKLAKLEGEFVWHKHDHTDEAFIVLEGQLKIELRDGCIELSEGEMYVVQKGVEHKPVAEAEVKVMIVEPKNVINTGDAEQGERTAQNDIWV
ncbi:cupin domain-containing protein [Arenicella sp. 4NH20-0111]|uniref:cupin domain-containing protein n=1 Tax=Arenicella sp. 4NH20-0111 TaxID=3127648 RepID=UPI00310AFD01